MFPRPRLFVKKRGTRRTGSRWAGELVEGLLFAGLIAAGALGVYWLIHDIVAVQNAGWWPWFAMIIPVALFFYGAVGLVALLWQQAASTERRAAAVRNATGWELPGIVARPDHPALPSVPAIDVVTDSPGIRLAYRLPLDAAAGWVSFTMAAVCIGWNTLVAVFVVQVVQMENDKAKWLLASIMVPFVLGGIWTLVELVRQVLLNIAVGTTRVEISQHPFYPGTLYQGFVSQAGRLHVRWMSVQIVCDEQAIHQQGTDTRRTICRVYRSTLYSQRKFDITPQQAFEATFDIAIPESTMHSFVSSHNAVMWALLVRGRMARWGDFERRFPIYVYPAAETLTPNSTPQLTNAPTAKT